ncbi:MAG: hypothetical protein ACP5N2_05855 [Candidatus Nanoarchaeia archaeon]
MNNALLKLSEGVRLTYTSTRNRFKKVKKYQGTTEEICRSIIDDCFDKKSKYFRVSPYNFKQFYARDFGMCCESLIYLGYRKEVKQTLIYALDKYAQRGEITTHLTPSGTPLDFPTHTPESAAYMLHSLIILNDTNLINKYSSFFSKISKYIFENDINKKTGLLRNDKHFSSMKDHALRESDCYNNCLLAMFAQDLKKIKIKTSLSKYNYRETIEKEFLKDYFLEDLSGNKVSGKDVFASDANIFPFWTGLFEGKNKDKQLLKNIIKKIRERKLDHPWPLKYTTKEDCSKKMHLANILCPGYETDTIWIHLGLCYMKTISDTDKKLSESYIKKYEELIQKHKTFFEVYDTDGKIFSRTLYKSDEAMLWCSIFLELYLKNNRQK